MSEQAIETKCFLCKTDAQCEKFDFGKRHHYLCSSPQCGEYIVTDTAMRKLRVRGTLSWKQQISALAAAKRTDNTVIEIWVNPQTRQLETHFVSRFRGRST